MKKEVEVIRISIQSILAFLGILAILFSLWKVFFPEIEFKILSEYFTFDKDRRGLFILKLQTISNVDLILEEVTINVTSENGKTYEMTPFSVRWKGVIFKMLDLKNQERDYKLLKPLEPDLRVYGIKQGSSESYVSVKSEKIFEDNPPRLWSFKLKYRQHLLPIPNIPLFNRKTISVIQPDAKDLYFDDSLFQKVSSEERQKLIDEL